MNLKSICLMITIFISIVPISASASTYLGSKSLVTGDYWDMGNGYFLMVGTIDGNSTPLTVNLALFNKNGILLASQTLIVGQTFNWKNIFTAKIDNILIGVNGKGGVKLTDIYFDEAALKSTPTPTATSTPVATGTLSISSVPSGASIIVDNNFQDITPKIVVLSAGSHLIELKNVGYQVWSQSVIVTAGSSSFITANLVSLQTPIASPTPTDTPQTTTATPTLTATVTYSQPKFTAQPSVVVADYAVSISPTNITVNPGDTLRFTIAVTPSGGFSESVEIYVKIKAPGYEKDIGRVKTFSPPYQPFVFEYQVPNDTPKGITINGYVTAKGGGIEHEAGTVTVKVPSFEISLMIVAVGMAIFLIRRKK